MKVGEILEIIEKFAPKELAREGDNVGLIVGNFEQEVKGVLFSLDPTLMAFKEAIEKNANLIITHHPLVFHPLKNFLKVSPALLFAIKNDLSVYAAHTNLDVAKGGIADVLSDLLDLVNVEKFDQEGVDFKVAMGRIGELKNTLSVEELAKFISEKLKTRVKILGEKERRVKKVAFCGGGGSGLLQEAYKRGAHVFLTGDVNHHAALLALELDIVVIDATHLATERVILKFLKDFLGENIASRGERIPLYIHEEKIPWWEVS